MTTNPQTEIDHAIKSTVAYTMSPGAFIRECAKIYDPGAAGWIDFELWPEQEETLETVHKNRLVIILKARQLGMTWLILAYMLWLMIFRPVAEILIFSRRGKEAAYLLKDRLRGMYIRLPGWIKGDLEIVRDNTEIFQLSNGSTARAFPTTAGDSYTGTMVLVDEADLVPDLDDLMKAVKPIIDAGGKMVLLSRVDKDRPISLFKKIYLGAKNKLNSWVAVFLPWFAHPDRDDAWYEIQKSDALINTGTLDGVHEQYPANDTEALSPNTFNKRIPTEHITNCYVEKKPISIPGAPIMPTAQYFKAPRRGRRYVVCGDPAEGLPSSDDSSMHVMDRRTGEEVFFAAGKFTPAAFAGYMDIIGQYYNNAPLLWERNNHGHAVEVWLKLNSQLSFFKGRDRRIGWQTNHLSKSLMYNDVAEAIGAQEIMIHSEKTFNQLASIEKNTLSAPVGLYDDAAISISLCILASAMKWPDAKGKKISSHQG